MLDDLGKDLADRGAVGAGESLHQALDTAGLATGGDRELEKPDRQLGAQRRHEPLHRRRVVSQGAGTQRSQPAEGVPELGMVLEAVGHHGAPGLERVGPGDALDGGVEQPAQLVRTVRQLATTDQRVLQLGDPCQEGLLRPLVTDLAEGRQRLTHQGQWPGQL